MRQKKTSRPVIVSRAAILIMLLLVQTFPARAEPPAQAPVASGLENETNQADPAVPSVARRLWHELHCACQETDCVHEALEALGATSAMRSERFWPALRPTRWGSLPRCGSSPR